MVAGRWSLVAGRWSLVAGRWSLVAGRVLYLFFGGFLEHLKYFNIVWRACKGSGQGENRRSRYYTACVLTAIGFCFIFIV